MSKAHRNDFDIVHVHSGFADYFIVSSRIKSQVRLPTFHTLYCPIAASGQWQLPVIHSLIRNWANRLDSHSAVAFEHGKVTYAVRDPQR